MSKLGSRASPEVLTEMAEAYSITHKQSDPVKVAQWRVDEFGLFHAECPLLVGMDHTSER